MSIIPQSTMMGLGTIGSRGIRSFRLVPTKCCLQRPFTTPSYSVPATVDISKAEVQSAKEYCSGLLQYVHVYFHAEI